MDLPTRCLKDCASDGSAYSLLQGKYAIYLVYSPMRLFRLYARM